MLEKKIISVYRAGICVPGPCFDPAVCPISLSHPLGVEMETSVLSSGSTSGYQ